MKILSVKSLLSMVCVALGVTACSQVSPELRARIELAEEVLEATPAPEPLPYTEGSYEHFICNHGYPTTMEIYRDEELLKKAGRKSAVHICLPQQRGRLYVDGKVAADWPVSTGVAGRETPTGAYSVIEKKKDHASNLYGNIKDADGKTVKVNADVTKDPVPEGGTFVGSPMPNWQRLTWDGLGMHTGKVQAGKRLSHGCIRTPNEMARELFDITGMGTRVHVMDELENDYPVRDLLPFSEQYQAVLKAHNDAQENLDKLRKQAEDEIAAREKAEENDENAAG
ncbi:MAG: L,D-transpeptidase family protein [Akkermansia sp.]|nr:L,D-transpeptidase family protein [Akkermansia sp.]